MKISGLDKSFYRSFIKTKKALVQQEGTIFQRYLAIQRKNHILFLQKLSTQIPHIDERKKIFVLIPAFYEQENILRTLESLYPKSKALEKFWQKKVVFLILNNYLPSRKETVTFQKTNLFKRKTGFRDVYVINLRHPGGGYNVGQCRKILHDLIIYLSVNTNRKLDNCVFASFDADILSSDLGIFKKAYRLLQQNPKIDAIQGKMTRLPKEFSPDKSLFFFFSTFYHYVRDEWQDQRFRKHGTPLYSLMWNRVFTYGTNLFLRPSTYCQIGGFEEVGLGEDYSIGAKISFLRARDGIRSAYVNTIKFLEYRTVNSPRRDLHCFPSQFFGAKQVYEKFGEYKFEKALRRNNSDLNEIYTILNNRYPLNKENVLKTLRIVSQKSLARISNPRENTALIDRALRRSVTDLKKTLGSQLSRFLLKRLEQKKILNDYTHAEQLFFAKTRLSLVSSNVKKNPTHLKKTSVIIPVFDDPANFRKTLLALKKQILPKAFLGHIEVVVVDDGSTKKDSKKLRESITKEPLPFKVYFT